MHERIDERSRAMHSLIAERLRRDPSLLALAKGNLSRWRETGSPRTSKIMEEWEILLQGDFETLLELLESPSEKAVQLRQSSPFAGESFITSEERLRILQRFHEPAAA